MEEYKPFSDEILNEAIKDAQTRHPQESCGVFSEGKYISFENKSSSPENSFLINSPQFNQLYMNEKIDCILHSHDEKTLSITPEDQRQQIELEVPFGVIHLNNKSYIKTIFWGDSIPIAPLMGRPFIWGVWDCYGLVTDYYRMKGYRMPKMVREWGFWHRNISMYEDFIENQKVPFYFIPVKESLPGDVLLYNLEGTKYLNHCGVMMEKNQVLHHFVNKVSGLFPVSLHRQFLNHSMRFDPKWRGFNG